MSTVRQALHGYRKNIDMAAFGRVAPGFFGTGDFWDMESNNDNLAFIDAMAVGTDIANAIGKSKHTSNEQAIEKACDEYMATVKTDIKSPAVRKQIQESLAEYIRILLSLDFTAYMTVYFKINFDGFSDYTSLSMDFHRPVTNEFMQNLKNEVKTAVEMFHNQPAINIRTISQEEYDRDTPEQEYKRIQEAENRLDEQILRIFCQIHCNERLCQSMNDAKKERVTTAFRELLQFDHPAEVSDEAIYKVHKRACEKIFTNDFYKLGQESEG